MQVKLLYLTQPSSHPGRGPLHHLEPSQRRFHIVPPFQRIFDALPDRVHHLARLIERKPRFCSFSDQRVTVYSLGRLTPRRLPSPPTGRLSFRSNAGLQSPEVPLHPDQRCTESLDRLPPRGHLHNLLLHCFPVPACQNVLNPFKAFMELRHFHIRYLSPTNPSPPRRYRRTAKAYQHRLQHTGHRHRVRARRRRPLVKRCFAKPGGTTGRASLDGQGGGGESAQTLPFDDSCDGSTAAPISILMNSITTTLPSFRRPIATMLPVKAIHPGPATPRMIRRIPASGSGF